jgi:hypothetical protein
VDVTIVGQHFQAGCSAELGTVSLTVTQCLPTVISATVPADIIAGFYNLTVTNPDSRWDTLTPAYTATNPIPSVVDVTPDLAPNDAVQTITITGGNFRNTGAPSLRVALDSTPLANVVFVNPSTLTADVPAGTSVGSYNVTVTNPGPTDPSGSLADAYTVYTYSTNVTCTGDVDNCDSASGDPDGNYAGVDPGEALTITFGVGNGIADGPGYDMVYYERPHGGGIQLDYVTVEIGDGTGWYTVFDWDGDSWDTTDVIGTNIDAYASDSGGPYPGEADNEEIPSAALYPRSATPNTGIAIDIGVLPVPAGSYHLVRFSNPGGSQQSEIDSVTRLN